MPEGHEIIARELNEQDWRVLFSFGYAGRYVPTNEIINEDAVFSAIRLNKRGLVDYFKDDGTGKSVYGLNENGRDFLGNYIHKMPSSLLFGAKAK